MVFIVSFPDLCLLSNFDFITTEILFYKQCSYIEVDSTLKTLYHMTSRLRVIDHEYIL